MMIKAWWVLHKSKIGTFYAKKYANIRLDIKDLRVFISRLREEGQIDTPIGKIIYSSLGPILIILLVEQNLVFAKKFLTCIKKKIVHKFGAPRIEDVVALLERFILFERPDPMGLVIACLRSDFEVFLESPPSPKIASRSLEKILSETLTYHFPPDFYFSRGLFDYAFLSSLQYVRENRSLVLSSLGVSSSRTINVSDIPKEYIVLNLKLLAQDYPLIHDFLSIKLGEYYINPKTISIYQKVVEKYYDLLKMNPLSLSILVDEHLILNPPILSKLIEHYKDYPFFRYHLELLDNYINLSQKLHFEFDYREFKREFQKRKEAISEDLKIIKNLNKQSLLDPKADVSPLFRLSKNIVIYLWLLDNFLYFARGANLNKQEVMEKESLFYINVIDKFHNLIGIIPVPIFIYLSAMQLIFSTAYKFWIYLGKENIHKSVSRYLEHLISSLEEKKSLMRYPNRLAIILSNIFRLYSSSGNQLPFKDELLGLYRWIVSKLMKNKLLSVGDKAYDDMYLYLDAAETAISLVIIDIILNRGTQKAEESLNSLLNFTVSLTKYLFTKGIIAFRYLADLELLVDDLKLDADSDAYQELKKLKNDMLEFICL